MSAPQISEELLAIIVCPDCKGDLSLTGEDAKQAGSEATDAELVCQGCGLAYPVRDGIPVLLVDEARRP